MKKLILLVCVFTLNKMVVLPQERYNHVTPQTADFIQSGKYPVSLYTGKINLTIPLYHIQDPDFDLPVSISYNADGFKPHKHPGIIGYNWNLNAGGCITREVANIPDEYKNVNNDDELAIDGFLSLSKKKTYNPTYIFNFSSIVGAFIPIEGGSDSIFSLYDNSNKLMDKFEYMPDVFSFNFCGKSGQFIIGNDGRVQVISDEWVDVDLSGIICYQPQKATFRCMPENILSQIKITDTQGYQYFFGGSNHSIEFSISVDCQTNGVANDNSNFQQTTPTINAWHLTKIIAPNGREMLFHYQLPTNAGCYQMTDPLWQYNLNRSSDGIVTMNATKSAILEKISLPDINFELEFNLTTEGTKKMYNNFSDFNNLNYRLNSIIGTIDNNQLANISFASVHYGGNSTRGYRFLKSICFSPTDNPHFYHFTYNTENVSFPDPCTISRQNIDDYGYWSSDNFIGLIKSVSHPTGGVSKFEFERHDYGTKRYYQYSNNNGMATISPELAYTVPMEIGGVRIKSVKNFINNEIKNHVIYNYTSKFDQEQSLNTYNNQLVPTNGTTNFGCIQTSTDTTNNVILSLCRETPGYQDAGIHSTGIFNSNHITLPFHPNLIKSQLADNYTFGEPHIGYREVTEINIDCINSNRTYKTYSFTDYITNPDVKASKFSTNINTKFLYSYQNTYSSLSLNRGKIRSEIARSTNKNIVHETTNLYCEDGNSYDALILDSNSQLYDTKSIVVFRNISGFSISKRLYFSPSIIKETRSVEITPNGSVEELTRFNYDDKYRIIESSKLLSNGKYAFTEYKYPDQIFESVQLPSNENLQGLHYLTKNLMISKPIEIANGIKNGTVKEYCSSQITLYKKLITQGDTIAAPYRQMQLGISSPVTNYSGINFSNGQLIVDNRMHTTVEFEFSNKLRLNKIGYPGELPIVYQWDSKLLHPQSETQGNHTTLYNYKPMVGLNSKTDSKGVTIYYEYDVSGRLISIKDNNLNLIQSFEYKYKTIPQP